MPSCPVEMWDLWAKMPCPGLTLGEWMRCDATRVCVKTHPWKALCIHPRSALFCSQLSSLKGHKFKVFVGIMEVVFWYVGRATFSAFFV